MPRLTRSLALLLPLAALAADGDPVAASLDRTVAFLEQRLCSDPDDFVAANQLGDRLLRRSRWTGRLDDLRRAGEIAALSLKAMPARQNSGALLLRGHVELATHRFTAARDTARELTPLDPGKPAPSLLLSDALLALGDLDAAERACDEAADHDADPLSIASRRAWLAWARGDLAATARHLDTTLTLARTDASPETLAWALVQRGEYAFRRGEHDAAEKLYVEAQSLAPSHWSVIEHLAELRGAQGRDTEAVQLFEQVARTTDRPELWQALGDLHAFYKRPAEAKAAHDRALAGYRASLDRGEVLYVHHLAGFFSDSQEDAAQAVKFAQQDLTLRQTSAAWDALAWAQYRHGDFATALETSAKAVGLADSHVLYHIAMIRLSAGAIADGQAMLRRCAEVNPHFATFHIHR